MRYPLIAIIVLLCTMTARAQEWTGPVRGSWVREGSAQAGDVTLAAPDGACEIVVAPSEHSAVQQAAIFLADDIERISGKRPAIVPIATGSRPTITLLTLAGGTAPDGIATDRLLGKWEAYQVLTRPNAVYLVGSNFRGTAFAAYTLSERIGIDPLYLWTGYTPEHRDTLVLKATDTVFGPPTFRYRGLFHDDEDILPRPIDAATGYPYIRGTVPTEWYRRYFETALRLRLNQVAPFTRVYRPFAIQKMASDWGLFYSSHHYDVLLSNPYGFTNFNLAQQRGVTGSYDYLNNKAGVLRYWQAGAIENRDLEAIYPVGLRGSDDYGYSFPPGTTLEQKAAVYEQAIREQVQLAKDAMPAGKTPLFHHTLYNEMLSAFQNGQFDVPAEVTIVWDDNGDGIMRALPQSPGKWKHGVYYHLAFFGDTSKQSVHTVTPMRIEQEFRKIVNAGATEYVLVNVSELREHVMETRFIAEIAWDAPRAFSAPDAAGRYVNWWSREYFGSAAAPLAADAYRRYYQINDAYNKIWYGSGYVKTLLDSLRRKLDGQPFGSVSAATKAALASREQAHQDAQDVISAAGAQMDASQRQFFFEHVALGLLIDLRPVQAARKLVEALEASGDDATWQRIDEAMPPLQQMEEEIRKAERPPFTDWYRPTWIRVSNPSSNWSDMNVHRPYEMLVQFLRGRDAAGYIAVRPFPAAGNGAGEIAGDLRGVDINTNPGSPYYGWVYICDRTSQANRILIYRPDPEAHRHGASAYVDTGLTIRVRSSNAQFPSSSLPYAPLGVSIGSDDTVWIADFSERQIESAPPVPSSGASVYSTVRINLPDFDASARAHLPSGWTAGNPRNLHVAGTQNAATVLVCNNTSDAVSTDNTVQAFAIDGNVVTHRFTRAIQPFSGTSAGQGATGYDATTDQLGNIYVPLHAAGGQTVIWKMDSNGATRPFPAVAPAGAPDANQPGIAFVADPSAPGGGYLYYAGRTADNSEIVYRYGLDGGFLDGLGAFFGRNILSGNALGYLEADDAGSLYARLGNSSTSANLAKIVRTPAHTDTGGPVKSSPAVSDGVAYFGGGDGRLYAIDTATGQPPAGSRFPLDIAAATAPGVAVLGRPAVRTVGNLVCVFFTTSDGRVGRVTQDGSGLVLTPPLVTPATPVALTPAVMDGIAYVAMGDGTGAYLFRVDADRLTVLPGTQPLYPAQQVESSPSVLDRNIYVGTDAGVFRLTDTGGGVVVHTISGAPTVGSPFIDLQAPGGPTMYAVSRAGTVYGVNAVNFTPVAGFGAGGQVGLLGPEGVPSVSSSPYAVKGTVYVGADDNRVYAVREDGGQGAGPGGAMVFFQAGPATVYGTGIPRGVAAVPAGDGDINIVFGSRNGLYYQVRADNPEVYRVTPMAPVPTAASAGMTSRSFDTVPAVDARTGCEYIGSDDGRVYRIPGF